MLFAMIMKRRMIKRKTKGKQQLIITEEGTAKGQREPDEEVGLDMKREPKDVHEDQREEAIRNVSDREGKRRRIKRNWMEKKGMKERRAKRVGESLVRSGEGRDGG